MLVLFVDGAVLLVCNL